MLVNVGNYDLQNSFLVNLEVIYYCLNSWRRTDQTASNLGRLWRLSTGALVEGLKHNGTFPMIYSYGRLWVITGYKWGNTLYKWGYKYL